MCSVAEWLIFCAFTAAPGNFFCFFNFHFHGCYAGIEPLVGVVTKRLGRGLTTAAPIIYARRLFMLYERPVLVLFKRQLQFFIAVHHDRTIPG